MEENEVQRIDVAELVQEHEILEKENANLRKQVESLQVQADTLANENFKLKTSREKLMQAVNLISHLL